MCVAQNHQCCVLLLRGTIRVICHGNILQPLSRYDREASSMVVRQVDGVSFNSSSDISDRPEVFINIRVVSIKNGILILERRLFRLSSFWFLSGSCSRTVYGAGIGDMHLVCNRRNVGNIWLCQTCLFGLGLS